MGQKNRVSNSMACQGCDGCSCKGCSHTGCSGCKAGRIDIQGGELMGRVEKISFVELKQMKDLNLRSRIDRMINDRMFV